MCYTTEFVEGAVLRRLEIIIGEIIVVQDRIYLILTSTTNLRIKITLEKDRGLFRTTATQFPKKDPIGMVRAAIIAEEAL